jgi:hypothetical protein
MPTCPRLPSHNLSFCESQHTLPKLALPSLTKNLVLDLSDTEDDPDGGRLVIARFARSARPS